MPAEITLVRPDRARLPAFIEALGRGWSANSERDTSAQQRAAAGADPDGFLAELNGGPGEITLADGRVVPRLPGQTLWVWDGGFAGSINLRHQPGGVELPEHVSGHIGYTIVPWRWRRGYATQALAAMLPWARGVGLPYVVVTCDHTNEGSRRVIEANGGVLQGRAPGHGVDKLVFRIALPG